VAVDLRNLLENAGVIPTSETAKEIHARCPMHVARTGHPDRHPSWSINKHTYVHFCFACGYKGTIRGLLIDLQGTAPENLEATIQRDTFLRRMAPVREAPEVYVEPVVTEWALRYRYTDVPQRLLEFRHLTRPAIDALQVRWAADTRQWVLPLRSFTGELLGAQYRQKGSVATLPEGLAKSALLFGFPQVSAGSYCALVESPLDAVRLFGLGIPAVSSLGAWVSHEQITVLARFFSRVFIALDDDDAGNQAADVVAPMLRRAGCVPLRWNYTGLVDEDGHKAKDLGDVASDDAVRDSWRRTWRMGL
jgi:hypothetical protein